MATSKKHFSRLLKLTTAALAFTFTVGAMSFGFAGSVEADYTEAQLADLIEQMKAENDALDAKIAGLNGDISENKELQDLYYQKFAAMEDEIDYYNNLIYCKQQEIDGKQTDIETTDLKIAAKEEDITLKEQKIEQLEQENKDNIKKFGEIIATLYMSGSDDIFNVLMNVEDFYDLYVSTEILDNVSKRNVEFMNKLMDAIKQNEDLKVELQNDIAALNLEKEQLKKDKDALETQKLDLEGNKDYSSQLSSEYETEYYNYATAVNSLESQQANMEYQKKINAKEAEQYEAQLQEIIRQKQLASTQQYVEGEWMWPVDTSYHLLTTYFGYDAWRGGHHSGIDIGNSGINGANIYATKDGTVIKAFTSDVSGYSYGKYVVIDHGNGYSSLYGHCSAVYVTEGQTVKKGDVIASVGSTGWSTGPHLHFEIRLNAVAFDPFTSGYLTKFW